MKKVTLIVAASILSACSQLPVDTYEDEYPWIEVEPETFAYQDELEGYQSTEHEVVLEAGEMMELKFSMEQNDTIVYQWHAEGVVEDLFLAEFHGHTEIPEGGKGTLVFYKKHHDSHENGSLTAAFPGDHGWYFENNSDTEVRIHLLAAGWYNSLREIPIE